MNPDFWKGRRVLVTGHTGFKGAWLSLWLQQLGAELAGFGHAPPTTPSLFADAGAGSGMVSVEGDVRDAAALARCFADHRPEIVIHLAAQPLVRHSYEAPVETFATNVMGTVNLLEAVRLSPGVRSVVIVTSDKCYANLERNRPFTESDCLGGYDPYSSSKACAELVTSAYSDSFFNAAAYASHGVAVATARAGNVIGGGDWARDRLVPDIIRSLQASSTVVLRHPGAIRPWQHVLEPLRGYLQLAEALVVEGPAKSGAWNFGPLDEDTRTVEWIADRIIALWGDGARWEPDGNANPHEARTLRLDCSKARAQLGWEPVLELPDTIGLVAGWYRAYHRASGAAGARRLVEREIACYEERIGC